jgi:hypothetical protein
MRGGEKSVVVWSSAGGERRRKLGDVERGVGRGCRGAEEPGEELGGGILRR